MKKMRTVIFTLSTCLLVAGGVSTTAWSDDVRSLRGMQELDENSTAGELKHYAKDGEPIARDYIQQPPLIEIVQQTGNRQVRPVTRVP